MVRHVFGATLSPSIVNLCLKKAVSANCEEFSQETVRTIERNMYVDDLMKSTRSTESAIVLVGQLIKLMKNSRFRLTKWLSNDQGVISEVPESERVDDLPTEMTLGLAWNVENNEFVLKAWSKMLTVASQRPMTRVRSA